MTILSRTQAILHQVNPSPFSYNINPPPFASSSMLQVPVREHNLASTKAVILVCTPVKPPRSLNQTISSHDPRGYRSGVHPEEPGSGHCPSTCPRLVASAPPPASPRHNHPYPITRCHARTFCRPAQYIPVQTLTRYSPCSKSPVTPSSVTVCKPSPRSLISVK